MEECFFLALFILDYVYSFFVKYTIPQPHRSRGGVSSFLPLIFFYQRSVGFILIRSDYLRGSKPGDPVFFDAQHHVTDNGTADALIAHKFGDHLRFRSAQLCRGDGGQSIGQLCPPRDQPQVERVGGDGILSVKNMDLRRKVVYRKRKKEDNTTDKTDQQYRVGRSYDEFQKFMLDNPECPVVQMDTVKGKREKGPVILTLLMLKYDVMLCFLLPDNTASAVIDIFDFLTDILDVDVFQRLFPVILTDNGSEFKRVEELE